MNQNKALYWLLLFVLSAILTPKVYGQDICDSRELSAIQSCATPNETPFHLIIPIPNLSSHKFYLQDGNFSESAESGTATLVGTLVNLEDNKIQFSLNVTFEQRSTSNSHAISHNCLPNVDNSGFYYYKLYRGMITGLNEMDGALIRVNNSRNIFQLGYGANWLDKNLAFGAAGKSMFSLTRNPSNGFILAPIARGGTNLFGSFHLGLTDCNPCALKGGDTDEDGICDEEDCAPDNKDLPVQERTACDDGNANTINDVIIAGKCECEGVEKGAITFDCNDDITATARFESNGIVVDYTLPTAVTTCALNGLEVNRTAGLASGSTFPIGTTTVTYVATDDCGNQKECTFDVTVTEADRCAELGGDTDEDGICDEEDCAPNNRDLPTQEGTACDDGDANTINDVIQADGCECKGVEKGAITFDCNDDITATARFESNGVVVDYTLPTAVTTCALNGLEVNRTTGLASGSTFPIGTTTVTYVTTDDCGNQKECTFDVTVTEADRCDELGGDTDGDGICDEEDCAPNNRDLPTQEGTACDDGDANTINDVIQADGCECKGVEKGAITFDCNDDITATARFESNGVVVDYTLPTAVTTCALNGLEVNRTAGLASGSTFPIGTTTVTYVATDDCGNQKECTFDVTVTEADRCAELGGDTDEDGICDEEDCAPNNRDLPTQEGTACDDGDANTINDVIQADGCECKGVEKGAITFDCNDDVTATARFESNGVVVDYTLPTAVTTCALNGLEVNRTAGLASGSTFPIGTTTVTYVATDDCGNQKECTFDVTVTEADRCAELGGDTDEDGICDEEDCAPNNKDLPTQEGTTCDDGDANTINDVIQADGCECKGVEKGAITFDCNDDITATARFESNGVVVDYTLPTAVTTCALNGLEVNRTTGLASGSTFPIGTTTVTYVATDDCGNQKECTFDVTVTEADRCDELGGDTDGDGICDEEDCAPNNKDLPTQEGTTCDDGDANTINDVIQADGCECKGVEKGAITFDCNDDITATAEFGATGTTVDYTLPTAITTCALNGLEVNRTEGLASGSTFPIGTTTVTYVATDDCGNQKECTFNVTVREGADPCAGDNSPIVTVETTNPICEENNGTITFYFEGRSNRTNIEFSLDGGQTYPLYVADDIGSASFDNLAAGNFDLSVRWGNDDCPVDLGQVTLSVTTKTPGSTCDDNDDETINDVILEDGCTCLGEIEDDNPIVVDPNACTSRTAFNTDRCGDGPTAGILYGGYMLLKDLGKHYSLQDGKFVEYKDGTANLTGVWTNIEDPEIVFEVDVKLAGRTVSTPPNSPKSHGCLETDESAYYYYLQTEGTLLGKGKVEGAKIKVGRAGPAFQFGIGANPTNSELSFGAAGWITLAIVDQPTTGMVLELFTSARGSNGDININLSGEPFTCLENRDAISNTCVEDITVDADAGTNGAVVNWETPTFSSNCIYNSNVDCSDAPSSVSGFEYLGELDGSKYFASTSTATYYEAKSRTIQEGGYLAVICSQEENDFITSKLTSDVTWIGFSDEVNEGTFLWSNGHGCDYTNWLGTDPNDGHNTNEYAGADHTVIQHNSGGWLDRNGAAKYKYIMEIPCTGAMPTGTADMTQTAGLASGTVFQVGETTVTYEGVDACGNTVTCNFKVTVRQGDAPDPCANLGGDRDGDGVCDDNDNCVDTPNSNQADADNDGIGDVCDTTNPESCDTDTDRCVSAALLAVTKNNDGSHTYSFKTTVDCRKALSHVDFEIPQGYKAIDLSTGGTYVGNGHSYTVENTVRSPFHGIRYNEQGEGINNGGMDVFQFTLSADAPILSAIRVEVKIGTDSYNMTVSTANCGGSTACIDVDQDGVCRADDCDDNNPALPATPGTACDDGNANTINDVILSDGCSCKGEELLDSDRDGRPDSEDCAPNNPNLPTTPGTSCDDGNSNTVNDVIQEDGCSCAGEATQSFSCDSGLLANPDFESGSDNWWWASNITASSDTYFGAKAALATGGAGGVGQSITATPGTIYTLSVYAKKDATESSVIGIKFYDANNNELKADHLAITSSDYQSYDLSAKAPQNTVKVTALGWKNEGTGKAWWDGFCFDAWTPTPADCNGINSCALLPSYNEYIFSVGMDEFDNFMDYDNADLTFCDNGDGTISIKGSIINGRDADWAANVVETCGAKDGWYVDLVLSDMQDWAAFGGNYVVNENCSDAYLGLDYWDVKGALTGIGCNSGRTLDVAGPAKGDNGGYRVQIGQGGNSHNCDYGLSTWFEATENGNPVFMDIYARIDAGCYESMRPAPVVVNDPCAGSNAPQVTVNASNPDCGQDNGKITFSFEDHSGRTNIEFSLDGGQTYPLNVSDNVGTASFDNLTEGKYELFVRWGNNECPVDLLAVRLEGNTSTPGASCNDGNDNTENDVIQSDGCTCSGDVVDDGECDDLLVNPSFEQYGLSPWKFNSNTSYNKSTRYRADGDYMVWIYKKYSHLKDAEIYQDAVAIPGAKYSFTFYSGTHNPGYNHEVAIEFYNSYGAQLARKAVQIDFDVDGGDYLQEYFLEDTAPTGTTKIRFVGTAAGDYLKLDAICVKVDKTNAQVSGRAAPGASGGTEEIGEEVFFELDEITLGSSVKKEGIQLDWYSKNSSLPSKYVIEKSVDGKGYIRIQEITDIIDEHLTIIDETPDYGTNSYRVIQEFENGQAIVSNIREEKYLLDPASITLYPNPAIHDLNLRIGHFSNLEGSIRIYSSMGQEVYEKTLSAEDKHLKINVSDFKNGMYFLIIEAKNRKPIERQFIVESLK